MFDTCDDHAHKIRSDKYTKVLVTGDTGKMSTVKHQSGWRDRMCSFSGEEYVATLARVEVEIL